MLKLRSILCLLGFVILVGCQKDEGPAKAPVSGQVTLDGTPLAEGQISFMPSNGVGISTGGKITNGSYREDVPLGEMRVEIRARTQVGEKPAYDAPDSPKMPIFEEKIPAKYNSNSELKTTVVKGTNKADYKLETPK